jgi:hypothetical protein
MKNIQLDTREKDLLLLLGALGLIISLYFFNNYIVAKGLLVNFFFTALLFNKNKIFVLRITKILYIFIPLLAFCIDLPILFENISNEIIAQMFPCEYAEKSLIDKIVSFYLQFKFIHFLGYDTNYFGAIFLVFFIYYRSIFAFIFILLTASKANLLIALTSFLFKKEKKISFLFYLLSALIVILFYRFFNFSESINMKLETIDSFIKMLTYFDLNVFIFGNNQISNTSLTTGHTFFGGLARDGVLYWIAIFFCYRSICRINSAQISTVIFSLFILSLISLSVFLFLFPLVYSLAALEKESI